MNYTIFDIDIIFSNVSNSFINELDKEWFFFKEKLQKNDIKITVDFVDEIEKEKKRKKIDSKFEIYKDTVYTKLGNGWIKVGINGIATSKIHIISEKNISPIKLFKMLEKILMIKILEKNRTFCHCSAFRLKKQALVFSSFRGGGKSAFLFKVFKKNNFDFIADDLAVIDKKGNIFTYPRGMSLNYYHGKLFFNKLVTQKINVLCKELLKVLLLKLKIKQTKPVIRLRVDELFKGKKLLKSLKIDRIFLIENEYDIEEKCKIENPEKNYILDFLCNNINLEKEEEYFYIKEILKVFSKEDTKIFFDYLEKIKLKQRSIYEEIIKNVEVKKIIIAPNFYKEKYINKIFTKIGIDQ